MITSLLILNGGDGDWEIKVGHTYLGHKVIKIKDFRFISNQYLIETDKGEITVSGTNRTVAFWEDDKK